MIRPLKPWRIPSSFKIKRVSLDALDAKSAIAQIHAYWASLASTNSLPARRQLDPLDLPPRILPWLFIIEVVQSFPVLDYRYRLVGTGNTSLVGRDATGHLASEIFAARETDVVPLSFDETVRTAQPTFWLATVPNDRIGSVEIERGLFPLAENGVDVDAVLGVALPIGGNPF